MFDKMSSRRNVFKIIGIFMLALGVGTMNVAKMKETVLADMARAFKAVTNVSVGVIQNEIIPEMYNITRSQKFIFKIPDPKNDLGFKMMTTDRSELMPPIFPNLTIKIEQMRLKSRTATLRNSEASSSRVKEMGSNRNEWKSLGLDGWSGELQQPTDFLESAHKDVKNVKAENSTAQSIDDILTKEIMDFKLNTANFNNETDLSENIYIARVNDPFGLSTKWAFRNLTNNATNFDISHDKRLKRDIVELYSMLKCATGCEPLLYQSYGCFCGFLGNGIAVDGIDSCCRMHDKCYEQSNCFSYLQYFVPYIWKCYHGKPLCALDHGQYGGPTSCAALLCYCDMRLAICLRKFQCPTRKAVCTTSLARKLQNLFL